MNQSLITREILNIEKWILKLDKQIKEIEIQKENCSGGGVIKNPFNLDKRFYTVNEDDNTIDLNLEKIKSSGMMVMCERSFDSLIKINKIYDISELDTSNVVSMYSIFNTCRSLTSLDLSNWNVSNVIHMERMFANCYGLTSLDLSNWDTSSVNDMNYMFSGCKGLTSLDLSNWNVSNVTKMDYMFQECSSLTSLDLSNWNISNTTEIIGMFIICNSLTSIIIGFDNQSTYEKLQPELPDSSKWSYSNDTITKSS